jgi:hypothetical protein
MREPTYFSKVKHNLAILSEKRQLFGHGVTDGVHKRLATLHAEQRMVQYN